MYCDGGISGIGSSQFTCVAANFTSVNNIYANGDFSFASTYIASEGGFESSKKMSVFINGTMGSFVSIVCSIGDICYIYCQSSGACPNIDLFCNDNCFVACNPANGILCPQSGEYTQINITTTTTTTTTTTSNPTSQPSFLPSIQPTAHGSGENMVNTTTITPTALATDVPNVTLPTTSSMAIATTRSTMTTTLETSIQLTTTKSNNIETTPNRNYTTVPASTTITKNANVTNATDALHPSQKMDKTMKI